MFLLTVQGTASTAEQLTAIANIQDPRSELSMTAVINNFMLSVCGALLLFVYTHPTIMLGFFSQKGGLLG